MLSDSKLSLRFESLKKWLNTILQYENMLQIAGDASFRRYFRLASGDQTLIAVDAPPELEDSHAFVNIAKIFDQAGLCVPQVIHADLSSGFMLISDLGDDLYFHRLNKENADELYMRAIERLHVIQTCSAEENTSLPQFSEMLFSEELNNFKTWYLETHLNLFLNDQNEKLLQTTFSSLIHSALTQPQLCVHRDYHSRNLFVLPHNEVGIIDFQDAVWGPITYDLVSLIRDCYIDWPKEWVERWLRKYYTDLSERAVLKHVSYDQFKQWFDWMGIQRHLKAIFIFARKWHRDKNENYLHDIPRALKYILDVSEDYPELFRFRNFLEATTESRIFKNG